MTELDHADLLAKYDEQLRTDAPSAIAVTRLGPLHLVTFPWGQGWVTYRDLDGRPDNAGWTTSWTTSGQIRRSTR